MLHRLTFAGNCAQKWRDLESWPCHLRSHTIQHCADASWWSSFHFTRRSPGVKGTYVLNWDATRQNKQSNRTLIRLTCARWSREPNISNRTGTQGEFLWSPYIQLPLLLSHYTNLPLLVLSQIKSPAIPVSLQSSWNHPSPPPTVYYGGGTVNYCMLINSSRGA